MLPTSFPDLYLVFSEITLEKSAVCDFPGAVVAGSRMQRYKCLQEHFARFILFAGVAQG
jgi:hypothetical protein